MSGAHRPTTEERLRAALDTAAIPPTVSAAWDGEPPMPERGQLWRARWNDTLLYVLILDAPSRSVRAVPVTLSATDADKTAAILPQTNSPLPIPIVLWLEDATSLPIRVLDRFLGTVHSDIASLTALPHGARLHTAADERNVIRARLQDQLDVFVSARWAPEGTGELETILRTVSGPQIAAALPGVPQQQLIAMRRGTAPMDAEQADQLAPVLGMSADDLLAANPPLPDDLIDALDLPAYRRKVDTLAAQRHITEIQAWRHAGYAVVGVAHRQTEGAPPTWTDRLDRYFEQVLNDH